MPHANFNVGLKAILKNDKGEILALESHNNGPTAGFYDLPGGRIDDTEIKIPFVEILKREIKEEVGDVQYNINEKPFLGLSWEWPNGQEMVFIYYEAKLDSGDVKISEEHLSYKWVELNEENIEKYFTSYHKEALKQFIKV